MHNKLHWLMAVATIIVLFGFPKSGVYIKEIPITFGYLLFALMGVFELVRIATHGKLRLEKRYLWLGLGLLSLAVVELYFFRAYGHKSFGIMVSVMVSTIAMPVLGILATHWMLRVLGMSTLLSALRWSLGIVFTFGLVSFLVYNFTGQILGVPFVTTTGDDLTLVATRHNLRGPIIKMFSTYNNGNILGINLLMWGPLVALSSLGSSLAYRTVCLLTLSRSVWVGLVGIEVFNALEARSYRRIFQAMIGAMLLGVAVIVASTMIGRDPMEFLLDKDLGGRVTNLQNDLEVMTRRRIGWDSESVPAAAWLAFGSVGLSIMAMTWLIPVIGSGSSPIQKTARTSLVVYLIVSCAEGAFILVPTQAIYWFVAAIALAPQHLIAIDESSPDLSTKKPNDDVTPTNQAEVPPRSKAALIPPLAVPEHPTSGSHVGGIWQ